MKELDLFSININYNIFLDLTIDIIIILYVDNILITNFDYKNIQYIKDILNEKFRIIDLKLYVFYLNIIITRDRINRIICLRQTFYIKRVLYNNKI